MEASEERRKLLCQCGKPLGIFTAQGLELYCRFSKESTTVPYTISNLEEAVALVESRRRRRRSRGWTFSLYPRKTLGDGSWVRMARAELSFHGIIGRSPAMRALFAEIERFASVDVPVLIRGESGTGKELVARAVQRLSCRRERPFETLNCADLTRELLRSELFGHERGAFTGTVSRTAGLVSRLDGGTPLPRRDRRAGARRAGSASCRRARGGAWA